MKKIILFILFIFVTNIAFADNTPKFERQGNTFVSKSTRSGNSTATKTKFTWKDSKGIEYPIYMSASGSCFVIKTSKKTGNEYKSYLGSEVSQQICKETGVEYKYKKK